MNAKQLLEHYISEHPDYWEFESEKREVLRLRKLCTSRSKKDKALLSERSHFQFLAKH